MKLIRSALATSLLIASATSAYARDLNLGFSTGLHNGVIDDEDNGRFTSKSAKVSVYTPLNEYISMGLTLGKESTDSDSPAYNYDGYTDIENTRVHMRISPRNVSTEEICLEAKISVPKSVLNSNYSPYIKIGRTIWSSYTYRGRVSLESLDFDYTYNGTQSGYSYCLGTSMDLADTVTLSAELESTKKEIVAKSKYSDFELEGDVSSVGLSLGVSVKV